MRTIKILAFDENTIAILKAMLISLGGESWLFATDSKAEFFHVCAENYLSWESLLAVQKSSLQEGLSGGFSLDRERASRGEEQLREIHVRESNRSLVIERRTTPVKDSDGNQIAVLLRHECVSERKRVEAQHIQSEKFGAIGRMAAGIAHDFNNSMTAVMSCVRLLERRIEGPPRRELQIIREGAQRATELTRKLMAFSTKDVVRPRKVEVHEVIKSSDTLLRRLVGTDIQLETILDAEDCFVFADPVRLEQAIINLVVNARNAIGEGGQIVLSCRKLLLEKPESSLVKDIPVGEYTEIVVKDTGKGMSPELQARAFEPFFSTQSSEGGSGLGLSVVFGAVIQADGYLRLESTLGIGTTVTLLFPAVSD